MLSHRLHRPAFRCIDLASAGRFSLMTNNNKILWLIFLILIFFSQISFANSDSTKYPITDPRNPNCPCHVYQKIADDEYNRIQNSQIISNKKNNSEVTTVLSKKYPSDAKTFSKKLKRKRRFEKRIFLKHSRRIFTKNSEWEKTKIKIRKCFVWQ